MAYQVKRQSKINEELQLLNKDGSVYATLTTNLNIDTVAKEFRTCQNDIVRANLNIKKAENIELAHTQLGDAFVKLLELIFGDVQTEKILEFYEHDYIEMVTDVSGFITSVIAPEIEKAVTERKKQLAEQYKRKGRR